MRGRIRVACSQLKAGEYRDEEGIAVRKRQDITSDVAAGRMNRGVASAKVSRFATGRDSLISRSNSEFQKKRSDSFM